MGIEFWGDPRIERGTSRTLEKKSLGGSNNG